LAIDAFRDSELTTLDTLTQPREISRSEAIQTAFSTDDTAVEIAANYMSRRDIMANEEKATPLTPEEANLRHPNMSVPFREPVKPVMAQFLADQNDRVAERERKLSLAPEDTLTKTAMFGAGILAHAMDPLEFAAGALGGWAVEGAAYLGLFGKTVKAAGDAVRLSQAGKAIASTKARVIKEGVEAFGGNLISNVALEGAVENRARAERRGYDLADGALNVAVGTVAGTVVHLGIKEGANGFNQLLRRVRTLSPDMAPHLLRNAIASVSDDVHVNPDLIINQVARETDIRVSDHGNKVAYEYAPLADSPGKKFYTVAKTSSGENVDVGDSFFGGKTATDSAPASNGAATRSFDTSPSTISQVELSDMKVLDLDRSAPPDVQALLDPVIKDIDAPEALFKDVSTRQALENIQGAVDAGLIDPSVMENIKNGLKDAGYDATVHDGTKRQGVDHSPHNVVEIINEGKVKTDGLRTPDPTVRNLPTEKDITTAKNYPTDPKNSNLYDIEIYDKEKVAYDSGERAAMADNNKMLDDKNIEYAEKIKELSEQGLIDSALSPEVQRLLEMPVKLETYHKLVKAATSCVGA
jgi:hypothetical protein